MLETRLGRIAPHSTDAEMSTLGAMMLDSNAIEKVLEILRPEDFYHPAHQTLCEVIYSLYERRMAVDLLTVQEELRRRNQLDEIGGLPALVAITESVPTATNAEYYARIVEEKAILRRLVQAAHEILHLVDEPDLSVQDIVDQSEHVVFQVSQRRMGRTFVQVGEKILEALEHFEEVQNSGRGILGVPTHFAALDRLTSGLQPSELIVLAARPSVGKTAFALNIAQNVAVRENRPVAIFSLEMSSEQLVQRMLCSLAGVSMERIRHARLNDEEWVRLRTAAERLFRAPIYIDDTTSLSPLEMRAKCRRLRAQTGDLALIVIDYLQLMRSTNRRVENRNQEIGEIARALKQLAREFVVPVLVLSQLSRAIERRENKRPVLSDLRDSGSIEAEADIVMFLHRESHHGDREGASAQTDQDSDVEVILSKHRNGPVGKIALRFQPALSRFVTIERTYTEV